MAAASGGDVLLLGVLLGIAAADLAAGVAGVVVGLAVVGRRVQTGLVRNYALAFLAGAVGILFYLAVKF